MHCNQPRISELRVTYFGERMEHTLKPQPLPSRQLAAVGAASSASALARVVRLSTRRAFAAGSLSSGIRDLHRLASWKVPWQEGQLGQPPPAENKTWIAQPPHKPCPQGNSKRAAARQLARIESAMLSRYAVHVESVAIPKVATFQSGSSQQQSNPSFLSKVSEL